MGKKPPRRPGRSGRGAEVGVRGSLCRCEAMWGWRTGALSLDAAGCDPKAGAVLTRVPSWGARLMWGQNAPGGMPDSSPRGRTPISAHPPRALTWGREVTDPERGGPCTLLPLFNAPFSWAQLQFWGFVGCIPHPPPVLKPYRSPHLSPSTPNPPRHPYLITT